MKKIGYHIVNLMCFITIIILFINTKFYLYNRESIFIFIFFSVLILTISFVLAKLGKIKTLRTIVVVNVVATLTLLFFHILRVNNLLYIFSSVNNFKIFILSTGNLGILIYILIQMLQIIILPIPASIIALAGAIIYGPFLGGLYCSIGVLLGSYLSFFIGRTLGHKIIRWIVGYENVKKYSSTLSSNGKIFLGIAYLLPMFPDDILCLIAGLTEMRFKDFFIVSTTFRPIGVFCMCYFGSGSIIPFSGWGIPLWILILSAMLTFVVVYYKNKSKIETWLLKKLKRQKEKTQ